MKRTIQLLILVIAMSLTGNSFAQKSIKIGHFSSTELIKKMPEGDSAQNCYEKIYGRASIREAESMQKEYQRLVTEYQEKRSSTFTIIERKQAKRNSISKPTFSRISTKC